MNIILLQLLDYLGHANPFISGVAYTEVRLIPYYQHYIYFVR